MTLNLPVGFIVVHASPRTTTLVQRMIESDWWQVMCREGRPGASAAFEDEVPVVYLFDFRGMAEKWEARLFAEFPSAEKVGLTPNNLLFMTGNNYRFRPKESG